MRGRWTVVMLAVMELACGSDTTAVRDATTGDLTADASAVIDAAGLPPDAPEVPADATPPDGPVAVDAGCAGELLGFDPTNLTACDVPVPVAVLPPLQGSWVLDTDVSELRTHKGDQIVALPLHFLPQVAPHPDLAVLALPSLAIPAGARLRVIGQRPLVLVIYGTATLAGEVFVGATGAAATASSVPALCADGRGSDGVAAAGGGGGGGGEAGGPGAGPASTSAAGAASMSPSLEPLRGGCSGGTGAGLGGGLGGGAAGALQIICGGTLHLSSTASVRATGGGGGGASAAGSGGGGGGGGGALLFEAQKIRVDGQLSANGGGGGEGSTPGSLVAAGTGQDGGVTSPAAGGALLLWGGDGGDGGSLGFPAGPGQYVSGAPDGAGGGGGGGGAGRIRLRSVEPIEIGLTAVVTPAALP